MNQNNMNIKDWLTKIESFHSQEIALGLERLSLVAKNVHLQPMKIPVIMVAGTNGKGSTVATLAILLTKAGLKIGTYTSPHLFRINERIQIDGIAVSDEDLCKTFEHIEKNRNEVPLTFFEFTTLAAFLLFQENKKLDALILEIGLGGRLDAVNLLPADLAIITSIDFDHEEWLGSTLEKIGKEKAGIFRKNIPVILGKKAQLSSILKEAQRHKNRVYQEGKDFNYIDSSSWHFNDEKVALPDFFLPKESVSLAMAAYNILKPTLLLSSLSEITYFLKGCKMIGRAHSIWVNQVMITFDVAHNADGARWLAERLSSSPSQNIIAVWSSLKDKSLEKIIAPLKGKISAWYTGALENVSRGASSLALTEALQMQKVKNIFVFSTLVKAFKEALDKAQMGDQIVVFGSFYTVSVILEAFNFEKEALINNGLFAQTL